MLSQKSLQKNRRKKGSFFKNLSYSNKKVSFFITYLRLDADLYEGSDDGEEIADDEQDVPAVNELHPVAPTHRPIQFASKVPYELLRRKSTSISQRF